MLKEFTSLFLKHTAPTRRHLTPELLLRLVTPACPLWAAPAHESSFTDPYWGFYWPGGQATARYILDNPDVAKDGRVLDVGCGCGAGSIAAAMVKAKRVVANDIDPCAVLATEINTKLNQCIIETDTKNYIDTACEHFDTILIGDMFYDEEFASVLFDWLIKLTASNKTVLIGDPGRHGLTARRRRQLQLMAEYELAPDTRAENHGYTTACVWRVRI